MSETYQWTYQNKLQKVIILSLQQFMQEDGELFKKSLLAINSKEIKFCQVLSYKGILSGNFVIPKKDRPIKKKDIFSFILDGNTLYLVDYGESVVKLVSKMNSSVEAEERSVLMFLLDLMSYMINEDVYFLEEYNERLEKIEMEIYERKSEGLERFIMTTRMDMNILSGYYQQLNNMGQTMEEISIRINQEEAQALLSLYTSRVSLLYAMVQQVKDNTDQIWNLRQTILSDRQNKISTVLTIVSVIFLPLTLITGWFGMNFVKMPFINSIQGYYGTVVFCILILAGELLYIKKKGLWK